MITAFLAPLGVSPQFLDASGYVEGVLKGASDGLSSVLDALGLFLGVCLLFVAAWKFFKAVTDNNQRVSNIFVGLAALVVGGFLTTATFTRLNTFSKGLGDQINDWGTAGG